MGRETGFTIVEVVVAILVFTLGVLGLASSAALLSRMGGRGQRSAAAAMFAARRLELLRVTGCKNQAPGTDTLYRGGTWIAVNSWLFINATNNTWRISLTETYKTAPGATRTERSETEISCFF